MNQIVQKLKAGLMTPEQAVDEANKGPFQDLTEVPLDSLVDTPLPCGFSSIDECNIIKEGIGELIVVAAIPGHGKTAFIVQVGTYIAQNYDVLFFSLEMELRAITQRQIAIDSGYSLRKVQKGMVPKAKLEEAQARMLTRSFKTVAQTGLDIRSICSYARDWRRRAKSPGVILIDYLQIAADDGRSNRHEDIAGVARCLKELAEELKVPVIAAAQMNKESVKRGQSSGDYRPGLTELAECSAIGRWAHAVIGISREEAHNGKRPGEVDVQVLKNRSGETSSFIFKWLGASVRFLDEGADI